MVAEKGMTAEEGEGVEGKTRKRRTIESTPRSPHVSRHWDFFHAPLKRHLNPEDVSEVLRLGPSESAGRCISELNILHVCLEIFWVSSIALRGPSSVVVMAGASDKARFYLEKYVPELQEYERKGIFTRDEITSIAAKRNDFEHTLNARGSRPTDYARYATYEMNLDKLRKKRSKRLGVQSTAFSAQRTIFFILDRATKKFPGDMGLWMQYIQFCQRERANKKLAKMFTSVLRLKPREWGLWVLAAKHYAESQGDMSTARSYMQRGLRFCKDERKLWLEYMRLEMVYLAKLAARRKILGLDEGSRDVGTDNGDDGEDMIALPTVTAEDFDPDTTGATGNGDVDTLQTLSATPAFTGGIPLAIFDAAMKQFGARVDIAEEFFEIVMSFYQLPASRRILQHILRQMRSLNADSAEAVISEVRLSLLDVEASHPDFPSALGTALATFRDGLTRTPSASQATFVEKILVLLLPYLERKDELDPDLVIVLESTTRRYLRMLNSEQSSSHKQIPARVLIDRLQVEQKLAHAALLQHYYDSIAPP